MNFSFKRLYAIILKEFTQMRRDAMTAAMIIGIPILQIILFGYAINTDPKHLPTVVVSADESVFTRTLLNDIQNSNYFDILPGYRSDAEADHLLRTAAVQFAIYIPPNFTKRLVRGEKPELL